MVFDRHYCSYLNIAQMMALGIHSVSRLHQGRKVDLPEGVNDKVVEWTRPLLSRCPDYISRDEWQQMPQKLHVRYIRICLQQQGFRPEHIIIAHNLIRWTLMQAASRSNVDLDRLSFKDSLDVRHHFKDSIYQHKKPADRKRCWIHLLRLIANDPNPLRPSRSEPRVIKRRMKCFPLLTKPRSPYSSALGIV